MAGDDALPQALAGRRVLLGVTGGIAAYKAALIARLLGQAGADVHVIMTPAATRFVGPDTFAALTRNPVYQDLFERPDTVLHVRLARLADVAVVAPATANVLAKLAVGLADQGSPEDLVRRYRVYQAVVREASAAIERNAVLDKETGLVWTRAPVGFSVRGRR